jgi:hypothetical protein
MLVAAFDASGHPCDQEFLVMAGFVSSSSDWNRFSINWSNRLKKSGIEYLHSSEILNQIPTHSERESLLRDLVDIIRKHAYRKFGLATLTKDLTSRISKHVRDEHHISAYSLAGLGCAEQVVEWWGKSERMASSPMAFVFEDGDNGKGKLRDLFARTGFPAPIFAPGKKPIRAQSGLMRFPFVPLQAADLLAKEYFMFVCDQAERQAGRIPKREPRRWLFEEFDRMPGSLFAIDMRGAKIFEPLLNTANHLHSLKTTAVTS